MVILEQLMARTHTKEGDGIIHGSQREMYNNGSAELRKP